MRSEEFLRREEKVTAEAPPAVQLDVRLLRPPRLAGMLAAGEEILECFRALRGALSEGRGDRTDAAGN